MPSGSVRLWPTSESGIKTLTLRYDPLQFDHFMATRDGDWEGYKSYGVLPGGEKIPLYKDEVRLYQEYQQLWKEVFFVELERKESN